MKCVTEIFKCDQCDKMMETPLITLLEHDYKHEHHYCTYGCLGKSTEGYHHK